MPKIVPPARLLGAISKHDDCNDIDLALLRRDPIKIVAERYGVKESTLYNRRRSLKDHPEYMRALMEAPPEPEVKPALKHVEKPPVTRNNDQVGHHPDVTQIDTEILRGTPRPSIAERYDVSFDSLYQRAQKLKQYPDYCKELSDTAIVNTHSLDVSDKYASLAERVEKIIADAETKENPYLAIAAAEGLRKVLKDIATMQGKLAHHHKVEVTVADSKEWQTLKAILEVVFNLHPDAKQSFFEELKRRNLAGEATVQNVTVGHGKHGLA